jgi:hypothetical protein
MARPEVPKMSEATTDSLIWASSSSFSARFLLGPLRGDEVDAVAGEIAQHPDLWGWHEAGSQHLPFSDLAQPHRV